MAIQFEGDLTAELRQGLGVILAKHSTNGWSRFIVGNLAQASHAYAGPRIFVRGTSPTGNLVQAAFDLEDDVVEEIDAYLSAH
jgi:hypothetical protein